MVVVTVQLNDDYDAAEIVDELETVEIVAVVVDELCMKDVVDVNDVDESVVVDLMIAVYLMMDDS